MGVPIAARFWAFVSDYHIVDPEDEAVYFRKVCEIVPDYTTPHLIKQKAMKFGNRRSHI
jgi:hypothetical protein